MISTQSKIESMVPYTTFLQAAREAPMGLTLVVLERSEIEQQKPEATSIGGVLGYFD